MRSRGIRYVSIHISYISIVSLLPSWDILVPLLIPLIGIHISFSFLGEGFILSRETLPSWTDELCIFSLLARQIFSYSLTTLWMTMVVA